MTYPNLASCLADRAAPWRRGPVMVVIVEDAVDVAATVQHHQNLGFRAVLVLSAGPVEAPGAIVVHHNGPWHEALTQIARALPDQTWLGYAFNGEYLYFPFCEDRTVGELLAFHAEERRSAMIGLVVDLYAADLDQHPLAVDHATAHLDARGYYALQREDPEQSYAKMDRQWNIYGGLKWRFEEHIPWHRRRIDRVVLFRTGPGITVTEGFTLSDPEMNTLNCAWHHNISCAIASFRTAKALRRSPGARADISSFVWPGSLAFEWTSQQLMDHGFMEPGQWF